MLSRRTLLGAAAVVPVARAAAAPPDAGGTTASADPNPLRVGVVGFVHGHISGFFDAAMTRNDVKVVGVAEPNDELAAKIMNRRGLGPDLRFRSAEELLDKAKPEAVVVYTSTLDHLPVILAAGARGVHVMVEKPLAVSVEHGQKIAAAAKRGKIHVLTNYETTWYPSLGTVWQLAKAQSALGPIREMVAHDGHAGPKKIGVGPEFMEWLIDPVKNGAGALYDFGCYGANLMTWLMDNQRPKTVTAVVQTQQPEAYPKVDDEATIVLAYEGAQGIIQGSWNWPFSRKDLEVYGATGHAVSLNRDDTRVRLGRTPEESAKAPPLPPAQASSLSYLRAVVRGEIPPDGLSSLENNLIVTEILDAARRSARLGRSVPLGAGRAARKA